MLTGKKEKDFDVIQVGSFAATQMMPPPPLHIASGAISLVTTGSPITGADENDLFQQRYHTFPVRTDDLVLRLQPSYSKSFVPVTKYVPVCLFVG
jgi:hypothetical protein